MTPICPSCRDGMDDEHHAACAPDLLRRLLFTVRQLARADRALIGAPDY